MKMKPISKLLLVAAIFAMTVGCARQRAERAKAVETITLDTTVLFDFDKADIRDDAKLLLDDTAEKLKVHVNMFVILEGHTDRRGPDEYNEVLAEKRARAVGAYLSQAGVGFRHMTFVSFGKREPKDPGDTEVAHQQNRRVEIRDSSVINDNNEEGRGE